VLEQAQLELLPEDAANRVVDPAHPDAPGPHLRDQGEAEVREAVRLHEHVDAGADPGADLRREVARQLMDAGPVADHDAAEAEPALQEAGDELAARVHLDRVADAVVGPVHARERRHHGVHAVLAHGRGVLAQGVAPERPAAGDRHPLVDRVLRPGAVDGEAVTREVLRRGEHAAGPQAVDRGLHLQDQPGVLAEALVGAAPAVVARGAHARREDPPRPGRARLLRGHAVDRPDEPRVAGRAERDVVREDRGAEQVAVPVHGVDPVEQRDAEPRGERGALEAVNHVRPRPRAVRIGHRAAAGQDAAEPEARDRARARIHVEALGLRHLAGLLLERHPLQEVRHALADRQPRVLVRRLRGRRPGAHGQPEREHDENAGGHGRHRGKLAPCPGGP
jgi:hypothetical protein